MNKLFNKNNRIYLLVLGIFLVVSLIGMVILPYGQTGITLFMLMILVGAVGMIGGLIPALGLTLLLFFSIGSVLFWMTFTGVELFENKVPLVYLLIWMIILLVISIMTGRLSKLVNELYKENKSLHEQIRTLVAIDPVTGFDNETRMLLDLKSEFNRAKRYGHSFTFMLIKLNHFDQLGKLYGEQEETRILNYISKNIFQYTRASDQKYRPEQDIFALLLPDTPVEHIHIVIEKLNKELEVFQLQNKKYISLLFEYGYIEFNQDLQDHTEIYKLAKDQVSEYVS